MVGALIHLFVKNKEDIESPRVRAAYGSVTGIVGILFNVFLFVIKGVVGFISGSISIVADAFNNLSDAASSIITMIGFKVASREADSDHPFGHGRSEYISGLIISVIIVYVGVELIKSSIEKIINPTGVDFSINLILALVISIVVKLYMFSYNRKYAKKLGSPAMDATAKDSINDVFVTSLVLISTLINHYFNINIDGPCGVLVGLFIIKGGVDTFKDTAGMIMGHGTDPGFKDKVVEIIKNYDNILDIHDLIVHDYGPGRRMISFHAEVPAEGDILELHDMIDNVEREISETLKTHAVIHMDPVVTGDERVNEIREMVSELASSMGEGVTIHDFRAVFGPSHTNLIFDMLLPFESGYGPQEAREHLTSLIRENNPTYYPVITVDRPA